MRDIMLGERLKLMLTDFARLMALVLSGERSGPPIRAKIESIEHSATRRDSRDILLTTRSSGGGKVRISLRAPRELGIADSYLG